MTSHAAIVLPREVARAIRAHARRDAPRECCGFLVGCGHRVQFAVAMPNRASGTRRYLVDPRAHIDLVRVLRRMQPTLDIVGVYHSHPLGPSHPSETDLSQAPDAHWIQLIAGPVGKRIPLTTYRFEAGRARRLVLHLSGGSGPEV